MQYVIEIRRTDVEPLRGGSLVSEHTLDVSGKFFAELCLGQAAHIGEPSPKLPELAFFSPRGDSPVLGSLIFIAN